MLFKVLKNIYPFKRYSRLKFEGVTGFRCPLTLFGPGGAECAPPVAFWKYFPKKNFFSTKFFFVNYFFCLVKILQKNFFSYN